MIKRVAAVHDICGYGKCSLGIAIPILSSFGLEVCPVPTGVFSTHTAIDNWSMLDTTKVLDDYINSWQKSKVKIDCIYSGFLTNEKQVYAIEQLYANNPNALLFVDPVMGDNGQLYKTYDNKLVDAIRRLISHADIITPNITEAQILTSSKDNVINKLHEMGPKTVILTSIVKDNKICNYLSNNGNITKYSYEYHPEQIHGTGDLFASCVLGMIMNDYNLEEAIDYASKFVLEAVKLTKLEPGYSSRGVSFEALLGKNTAATTAHTPAKTVGNICQP